MSDDRKRRASGVPGRSLSLVPTLSAEQANAKPSDNRVLINVGGVKYETYKSTLKNIPDTRLSWITESTGHNPDYDPETKEYFFDRHPGVFNMVLNYYRTGKLHAPIDVCGPLFEEELTFWGIDEKQIEACCWMTYSTHRDAQETLAELDGGAGHDDDDDDLGMDDEIARRFGIMEDNNEHRRSGWAVWRPRVWSLLEEPYSSKGAQIMAAISMMFVLLSITGFVLESHSLFRTPYNSSLTIDDSWTVLDITNLSYASPVLDVLDIVCVTYFTLEFLVRLIFCPSKLSFFKNVLNWVDLLSILPFYIEKLIMLSQPGPLKGGTIQFFKTIRLIRIFRIFKLTRHFSGLKILGHTIKASAKEMILLIIILVILILVFACAVYLAEQADEHPQNYFKNIPIGLWWACVTMTTLGYGDIYPRTVLGYLVGAVCAVTGVLVLALPVPVIVNNFALYYSHAQAQLKLPKKRRRILVGAADALKTQIGMPGESFAESGQVAQSPTPSEHHSPGAGGGGRPAGGGAGGEGERKASPVSMGSFDSGIKTEDSNASGSSCGISVIFTDETSLGDSPNPARKASSREGSLKIHQRSQKSVAGNSAASPRGMVKPTNGVKHCTGGHQACNGAAPNMHKTHNGVALNVHTAGDTTPKRVVAVAHRDSVSTRSSLSPPSVDGTGHRKRRQSLMPRPSLSDVDI